MAIKNNRSEWQADDSGAELLDITVGDLLDSQATALPDKEAIIYRYPELGLELRLTFSQLRDKANQIAKGFMALGVEAGDKVAMLATNVPEWFLMEFALPKIGAVLVTVNTNSKQTELDYLLKQAEVNTLVTMPDYRGNDYMQTLQALVPELQAMTDPDLQAVQNSDFPKLRHIVLLDLPGEARQCPPGFIPFERLAELGQSVSDEALAQRQAAVRPHDVSQIQFTSGTTGSPKGAMITHHSTINNARLFGDRACMTESDIMLSAMPMFHTAANVMETLGMLAKGGTIVKAISFEPAKMLELVHHEKPTILSGVPTMAIAMMREPRFIAGDFDVSSLRKLIAGGTPMPVPVLEQVKAQLNCDPMVGFGMTEASPMVTGTLENDSFELKAGTVGVPLPHIDLKIVDDQGQVVPLGQGGELLIRGFGVTKGYYRMPEKTAEAIDAEGWLHSGDMASLDAGGYVRIVGRIKDMIIRGGENVYPAEVESFLMRHPKVSQAQVVGIPDDYMGEEAAAFIQVKDGQSLTADELRDHCKAHMARHKLPKYFCFVDSYPMTPSGKIRKFELKDQLMRELASEKCEGKA
jgi:fatty-acyl-CoA synthase